jgi:hypothetical protein
MKEIHASRLQSANENKAIMRDALTNMNAQTNQMLTLFGSLVSILQNS